MHQITLFCFMNAIEYFYWATRENALIDADCTHGITAAGNIGSNINQFIA